MVEGDRGWKLGRKEGWKCTGNGRGGLGGRIPEVMEAGK